jgi:hypothetical protein
MSRKLVPIALLALACLLVIFAVSLNRIIDENRARIQQDLARSLGRAVNFGAIGLSFWGGPGVSAKDLSIADDPRFAATPFIQAKELRMQLRWLPLFAGRLEINRFVLEQPEIQIIRNEAGLINIETIATHEDIASEPGGARDKKRPNAPRLMISSIAIKNGSVDYIDRASREPIEVRARRLNLVAVGALDEPARVRIAADLFEQQSGNFTVEGRVGPWPADAPWDRIPLDLRLRCDALLLPQLMRAIPALRTTALRAFDADGPVSIRSKIDGTFARPHFADLYFTGSFFGAGENNTLIRGDLDFSRADSWSEGAVRINIAVDPLALGRLKTIPWLRESLPEALSAEGDATFAGEWEGTLGNLKARATVKAAASEIAYGNWLKKAKGVPAEIRINLERSKDRLVMLESWVAIQDSKMLFSGAIDERPERRLALRLAADGVNAAGWQKFLPPLAGYNLGGKVNWEIEVTKTLSSEAGFEIRGVLGFDGVEIKDKKSGRGVDRAAGRMVFRGNDARVERLAFRAGASEFFLEGTVADLSKPALGYSVRSAVLKVGDLTVGAAYKNDEMKSVAGAGELQFDAGKVVIRGNVESTEGTLQDLPYRNLRAEVVWRPAGFSFQNFSLQSLGGNFRAGGSWEKGADNSLRLALSPAIESVDLSALLARKFSRFQDAIDGRLSLKAKLAAETKNVSDLAESLLGEGQALVRNGALKDFNLIQLVLSKVSGLRGIAGLRLPKRIAPLADRNDTPFDSFSATFTIRQGRIHSHDVFFSTADYAVSADGSVGLDKSMKWDATLTLSPQSTQYLLQEYKTVRGLIDDQGRLAVPFRIEGRLPRVQVQPDLQKLGQQMQHAKPPAVGRRPAR